MSETPRSRTPHTARATTGRRRRAPRQPYAWLGVGALTVGVGAALAAGSGVAYADTPHSAAASSTSSSTSPSTAAGPKASATRTFAVSKTTSSVGGSPLSHAATPTPNPVAAALRAATPASATPGVHPVLPFTAKPSPALAVFRSTASTPAAATTAAAAVVTTSVSPAATVAISPLHSVLTVVTNALLSLGGLNTTTPTPASGNLIQLALYSAARWLQDTFNPGGIPQAGTPIVSTPDPTTGALTFRPVFTDPAGAPLTYKVSVDPTLGTVSVNADGVYTFTPTTAERLLAPAGGTTVPLHVIVYNGPQSSSQTISAQVNPATLTVLPPTIPVSGGHVGQLAVSPDGRFVYATGGLAEGTLSVINTASDTVTATIPIGDTADGVAVSPDGLAAYVTTFNETLNESAVSEVALIDNTVVATVPLGSGDSSAFVTVGPAHTPVAGQLFVSDLGAVSVINPDSNTITAKIAEPGVEGVGQVAISSNGAYAYVADNAENAVLVINTATNKVTATIPVSTVNGSAAIRLAVSPDGNHVYAVADGDNLAVINTATNKVTATITLGGPPVAVAVSPDGSVVYVTTAGPGNVNAGSTVSVISTASNNVIQSIPIGSISEGIAVNPDGTQLYVDDEGTGVSVVSV